MKKVFTTTEAARICGVGPKTIIRCFDEGSLGGFRTPTSGKFRRIPREMLYKFMKENGIPTTELDAEMTSGMTGAEVLSFQI